MTPELLTANTTMSAGRAVGQAARGISKGISRGIGMKEEARVVNYTLEIWLKKTWRLVGNLNTKLIAWYIIFTMYIYIYTFKYTLQIITVAAGAFDTPY